MAPHGQSGMLVLLLGRAQQGDTDARDELLLRLAPSITRYVRSRLGRPLVPSDLLDDIRQEALADLARGFGGCLARTDAQLVTWAKTVTWHAAVDYLAAPRSGVQLLRGGVELDGQAVDAAIEQPIDLEPAFPLDARGDARGVLYRIAVDAQRDLSPSLPPLLWYRLIQGDSWEEIGARFGTTAAGAKRRFQRACGALRRAVARRRHELDPATRRSIEDLLRRPRQS